MEAGSVVRVARQPADMDCQIEGEIGYIEEIRGPSAIFVALHLSGRSTGSGCVPLSCLEPETDPAWIAAKAANDARLAAVEQNLRAFNARLDERREQLAAKYGITAEAVRDIFSSLTEVYDEYRG